MNTKKDITQTIIALLEAMGVSSPSVSVLTDDFGTVYMVETKESDLLIGNRGETLLSLNHLVKRMIEKEEGVENFSVDVNGYQKERNEELRARARVYAERAKTFQSDVEMDPMSSYERMMVHAALSGEGHIKTESVGVGRDRRVVIKYIPDTDQKI